MKRGASETQPSAPLLAARLILEPIKVTQTVMARRPPSRVASTLAERPSPLDRLLRTPAVCVM